MKIPKGKALEKLRDLAMRGQNLGTNDTDDPLFKKWKNDCEAALRNIFGADSAQFKRFEKISFHPWIVSIGGDNTAAYASAFRSGMTSAVKQIEAFADEVSEFWPEEHATPARDTILDAKGSYDVAQLCAALRAAFPGVSAGFLGIAPGFPGVSVGFLGAAPGFPGAAPRFRGVRRAFQRPSPQFGREFSANPARTRAQRILWRLH